MKRFPLLFIFLGAILFLSGCLIVPPMPPRMFADFPVSSQTDPAFEGDHPVVARATNVLVPAFEKLGSEIGKPGRGVFGKHFVQEFHHPKFNYTVSLLAAYHKRPKQQTVLFLSVAFYGSNLRKMTTDHEAIVREVENLLHREFPEVKFTGSRPPVIER